MQTTLRIDDKLYRKVKSRAASEGITLTRFLEEGLRLRLNPSAALPKKQKPFSLPVYNLGKPVTIDAAKIKRIADEEQELYDLKKLGLI